MKKFLLILSIVAICVVAGCNILVTVFSADCYSSVNEVPQCSYGILFGTGRSAAPSPYYEARVQAAVELLKADKINVLIISGENQYQDYHEVDSMAAYIKKKCPDAVLELDTKGTDTYASLHNAGNKYGYNESYVLISQHFHNQRALFYARQLFSGNVVAYDAKDTQNSWWRIRNLFREILARTKAVLITYLF